MKVFGTQNQVAFGIGLGKAELDAFLSGALFEVVGVIFQQAFEALFTAHRGFPHAFLIFIAGDKIQRFINGLNAFFMFSLFGEKIRLLLNSSRR